MDTIKKEQKRNFSNTISAGLKSFGGKGKTFYVLEFKTNTQLHRAGTSKQMIVDYVEIGRSSKCQIRFGEDCRLVSGAHCAIVREGDTYFLKHLSKTNPTLINGKPIADKWYLYSGDEIQLAYGGPILGFMVPVNNYTSSIPLTRRLSLFRDQALRPFKMAIASLSVILLLCIAGFIVYVSIQSKTVKNIRADLFKVTLEGTRLSNKNDSLNKEFIIVNEKVEKGKKAIDILKGKILNLYNTSKNTTSPKIGGPPPPPPPSSLNSLFGSVYKVYATDVEIEIDGKTKRRDGDWTGTGFLLNDGRFVTARHVVEPWKFLSKDDGEVEVIENLVSSNGGKVICHFKAVSSNGDELFFSSDNCIVNTSGDKQIIQEVDNEKYAVTKGTLLTDWAVIKTKKYGLLSVDGTLSASLQMGTELFTLGFPFGLGGGTSGIEPMYANFTVSSSGVNNGFINISSKSFDPGNSGGPVFIKAQDGYKVIGIISAGLGSQGIIIPIEKIN